MPTLTDLLAFALVALGTVLTPGPNMIYLISCSIYQGCNTGLVSLAGIATGFVFYMLCATLDITALLIAVPFAYNMPRFGNAIYLLYLAWQATRPGGQAPFQVRELSVDSPRKLHTMGLLTNLLNPKVAVLYLSLLPQLIESAHGSVLVQSVCLGLTQICVSLTVNSMIVTTAGSIAAFPSRKPSWLPVQCYLIGTVLTSLALRMAMEARRQPHRADETIRRQIETGRSGLAGSSHFH